jgi:glutathione S-transferase
VPTPPLLYTFRRCPYAIRARMAIAAAGLRVSEQEVSLRAKPAAMLVLSEKGTVPVLHCEDDSVIDESLDIMRWALMQNDPEGWLRAVPETDTLIARNDGPFKLALDRYKYPQRFADSNRTAARQDCEAVLADLNQRLTAQPFLGGERAGLVDACLFPFVRQFAAVDAEWFANSPYHHAQRWLQQWTASSLFTRVMSRPAPAVPEPPG